MKAQIVYRNGAIYTVDPNNRWASSVAIDEGRFVYVGDEEGVDAFIAADTLVHDLSGRMVMPGLHDMHIHAAFGGLKALFHCNFSANCSVDEIVAAVASFAAADSSGGWLIGGDWWMGIAKQLDRRLLDEVVGNRPVFLWDVSLHNAWVNSAALRLAGIDAHTPDPVNGRIVRDGKGEPTGLLLEDAAMQLFKLVPTHTHVEHVAAIQYHMPMLNRLGITSIKEPACGRDILAAYKAIDEDDGLTVRVGAHLMWITPFTFDPDDMKALVEERHRYAGKRIHVDFLKLFLDGVPIAKTAAMLAAYCDDDADGHDPTALLLVSPDQLKEVLIRFDREGMIVKMHATGDGSMRVALDAIEAARNANGMSGLGHEIAHAQHIDPADRHRFASLEAVPDLCPILWHPTPVSVNIALPLMGEERYNRQWPIRTYVESGAYPIGGTDWPAMYPQPNNWLGIEAMITRRDPAGVTPGQLNPSEAIDLATALEIYTINGARSMRLEQQTGSIEVGKYADMIVLNQNLFNIEPHQIGATTVLLTLLEGKPVYSAEE